MPRHPRRLGLVPEIRTGQVEIDRALDPLRDAVNELVQRPIPRAMLEASLNAGLNKIGHGMGDAPRAFNCITDTAGAVVSDKQKDNPFPHRDLWVWLDGVASARAVIWLY